MAITFDLTYDPQKAATIAYLNDLLKLSGSFADKKNSTYPNEKLAGLKSAIRDKLVELVVIDQKTQ